MSEKSKKKFKPYYNHRTKSMVWPKSSEPGKEKGKQLMSEDTPQKQDASFTKQPEAGRMPESVGIADRVDATESKADGLSAAQQSVSFEIDSNKVASGSVQEPKTDEEGKKGKLDPETFEQFIEYAYGRKGQKLSLKPRVEKQISQSLSKEQGYLARLLDLAKQDKLLAVPRQLLLVSKEVQGYPALKNAFLQFVSNVMLRHPVFVDKTLEDAINNVPDSISMSAALKKVCEFEPSANEGQGDLKTSELQVLRGNAINLLTIWFAISRSPSLDELTTLLYEIVWQPAARKLDNENQRLAAITEIRDVAGTGFACQRFEQKASAALLIQTQAQIEAESLRQKLQLMQDKLTSAEGKINDLQADLDTLTKSSTSETQRLKEQHQVEKTHLRHELEQLQGKLVKRLTDNVEMLDVGLSALRKSEPRVSVMVERAEMVVDALRSQIDELKEG